MTVLRVNGGCEVIAIFGAYSVLQSKTSNRKLFVNQSLDALFRENYPHGRGVKCEVAFGLEKSIIFAVGNCCAQNRKKFKIIVDYLVHYGNLSV